MSIQNQLNPNLLNENTIYNLSNQFKSAKPFPHIQIKNFLKPKQASALLNSVKNLEFKEKESDLFQFKQTDDLFFSKNKIIKEFNSSCLSWEFFSLIEKITNSNFKGTLDMSATLYESTDFLLPHDDELEGRKIAYILYLSKNFKRKDGGSLIIYNSKNNRPTIISHKISPIFNSLILFEVSKKSFHEVEENLSKKDRYAIGGWLH